MRRFQAKAFSFGPPRRKGPSALMVLGRGERHCGMKILIRRFAFVVADPSQIMAVRRSLLKSFWPFEIRKRSGTVRLAIVARSRFELAQRLAPRNGQRRYTASSQTDAISNSMGADDLEGAVVLALLQHLNRAAG